MGYRRRSVNGTSGQDLNNINENFMDIFSKVFGDINFSDTDKRTQNRINTQWIPVQGDGNLDSNNPLYIRFFVPPNTKEVKSSNFNILTEHYRMDSSITSSAESKHEVISIISSASPSSSQTSNTVPSQTPTSSTEPQKNVTGTSATVGVSSVSNVTVGVSSVGGGGSTSLGGGGDVRYVRKWGTPPYEYSAPTQDINPSSNVSRLNGGYFYTPGRDDMGTQPIFAKYSGIDISLVDFYRLQHSHEIPSHTHGVPSHSHSVSLQGHSHSVSLAPHSHEMLIPAHSHTITVPSHNHSITIPSHTHTVDGSVTIPGHNHTLNEGIKVSGTAPANVNFHINNTSFAVLQGSNTSNNIDLTNHVKIGEWNVIKVTSSTVARATLYGTIELLIK